MKKLLTITAILISVVSFGQNLKLYKSTDDIRVSDLLYRKYLDDGNSHYQFWNWGKNPEQIAVIRSSGKDTLEITYPSLVERKNLFKYIKIGDKVFQEVEQSGVRFFNGYGITNPIAITGYVTNSETIRILDTSSLLGYKTNGRYINNLDSLNSVSKPKLLTLDDTLALLKPYPRITGKLLDSLFSIRKPKQK